MPFAATWADALQAMISVFGFGFIFYQIRHIRKAMLASAHDRLEAHYADVLHILLERPRLRPYFYASAIYKPSSDPDGTLRAEIDAVSECILGLIEHASLQRDSLVDHTWESCWVPYARERLAKSAELCEFLRQNRHWYTAEMCALLDGVPEHVPAPLAVQPAA